MPIYTMRFEIPEEDSEFKNALEGGDMRSCLWDIAQEVFRPARKHGYHQPKIAELFSKNPEYAEELIGLLEEHFYDILRSRNISTSEG